MTSPRFHSASSTGIPTAKEFLFSNAVLDDETLAIQEKAFFRSIRLRNGTYKTTYSRRLDSLNEIVNTVLPSQRPLEIMDVAASSGVATLEWIESLEGGGIDFRMTAGDLCVQAFLLSFGRSLNVLVDNTGYPLQFDVGGRAVPFPPPRRLALKSPQLFIGVHAARWLMPSLLSARSRFRLECRETCLISPRLSRRTSLTILEDDLLSAGSFENRFDVIRAANVLNKSYFDDTTLTAMIGNLRRRLRGAGLLIVCRTHDDGMNHGTIFRLNDARLFEIASRVGNGSEIESLVVQ